MSNPGDGTINPSQIYDNLNGPTFEDIAKRRRDDAIYQRAESARRDRDKVREQKNKSENVGQKQGAPKTSSSSTTTHSASLVSKVNTSPAIKSTTTSSPATKSTTTSIAATPANKSTTTSKSTSSVSHSTSRSSAATATSAATTTSTATSTANRIKCCTVCNAEFGRPSDYQRHKDSQVVCPDCNTTICGQINYNSHRARNHPGTNATMKTVAEKHFKCPFDGCDKEYVRKDALQRHMRKPNVHPQP